MLNKVFKNHTSSPFNGKCTKIKDWIMDHSAAGFEDIYRLSSAIYGVQSVTYWLILNSGLISLGFGMLLSMRGDEVLSQILISIGTGLLAIWLANLLQRLTTSIPRAEWTREVSSCSDDLVSYLLEISGGRVMFRETKTYSREMKAIITREVYATQYNVMSLEILLRKRDIGFLIDLRPQQLEQINKYLLRIDQDIDSVSRNYGRPATNREFNRDLAQLRSSLQDVIHTTARSAKRVSHSVDITDKRPGLFSQHRIYEKRSIQRQIKIYTRYEHKELEPDPKMLLVAIKLIQYLKDLTTFTNVYGYSNNAAYSVVKSRLLYIRAISKQLW